MLRRLTTIDMSQVQVPLELMLNPRPKWACLEDMHVEVKDLHMQFQMTRNNFISEFSRLRVPEAEDVMSKITYLKYWLQKVET